MVIHSVAPLQMLVEQESDGQHPEIKEINGGYIEGKATPQGFQMTRLYSTDPQMYLQKKFVPGSLING